MRWGFGGVWGGGGGSAVGFFREIPWGGSPKREGPRCREVCISVKWVPFVKLAFSPGNRADFEPKMGLFSAFSHYVFNDCGRNRGFHSDFALCTIWAQTGSAKKAFLRSKNAPFLGQNANLINGACFARPPGGVGGGSIGGGGCARGPFTAKKRPLCDETAFDSVPPRSWAMGLSIHRRESWQQLSCWLKSWSCSYMSERLKYCCHSWPFTPTIF